MFLKELKVPAARLKGIGPGAVKSLSTLDIIYVSDLLLHFPRSYEDRKNKHPLKDSYSGNPVNTIATVKKHSYIGSGLKRTLKVHIEDETDSAVLICFGRNFLAEKLSIGKKLRLYGAFEYKYGELQSSSFDFEPLDSPSDIFGHIIPVYPLASGLNQKQLRKAIKQALSQYALNLEEELPEDVIDRESLFSMKEALRYIHFPENMESMEGARKTLIFHELFLMQLHLARKSAENHKPTRELYSVPTNLQQKLIESLPFSLTPDQATSLQDIRKDMEKNNPMSRLIQGDVGSGKTLVAFLAAMPCIEMGRQVAFMAPTELLARQHADNAAKILAPLGIRLAFISGNVKTKGRKKMLEELKLGNIDLIIGTHALFSSDVEFKDLSLIIVDEQHRFGVLQRKALADKALYPDILLMTATPIPRTLTLTAFGDLDVSVIKTMPPGRKPIHTHLSRRGHEERVYSFVLNELRQGRQAYFVYPLIEQSEKSDLKDAEGMYQFLQSDVFKDFSVGLLHSKIDEEDKKKIMNDFKSNKHQILVATSVVEVGVDIPNATIMVIEHAERFGLSALHQLRGRVGRGETQSYAFLIYSENLTEDGKKRLITMKETTDGFVIAEADLAIRGPGEITGTKQSGFLKLHIADLIRDRKVLIKVRKTAFALIEQDPGFLLPPNEPLRNLYAKAPPYQEWTTSAI